MKVEKLLGDNEYIKNIHKMLENKVDEEVSKRLRHEFENKQWMEHKLGTFKDEIVTYLLELSKYLRSQTAALG